MHRIHYTIRRLAAADLPTVRDMDGTQRAATADELMNFGLVPLGDDLYSCCEQYRRVSLDPPTWECVGPPVVGELLSTGQDRYSRLPDDVRPLVMRAAVIAAVDGEISVPALAQGNIDEQSAMIAEFVGDVDGAPLTALSIEEEAARLAAIPDNGIERTTIPMGDVDADLHVVQATNLVPHTWAGERPPR